MTNRELCSTVRLELRAKPIDNMVYRCIYMVIRGILLQNNAFRETSRSVYTKNNI